MITIGVKEDTVWLTELFSLKSLMPARKRQLNSTQLLH